MGDGSDRRGRKRAARREALLELAAEIVAESGVDGLTMAALAEVSDYVPASLYTYFQSRSALVAALQQRALLVLAEVARTSVQRWDACLEAEKDTVDSRVGALAGLWAFSRLLLTAPDHHPREFLLQQQILVSPDAEDVEDAASVVPVAMLVLDVPRALLERARLAGVLDEGLPQKSPLGEPVVVDILRTITWVTALNGALLTDRVSTGLPTTGLMLGSEITRGLLVGWGADPGLVESAREFAELNLAMPTRLGQGTPKEVGA